MKGGGLTTQWLNPGVRTSIPTIGERWWSDTKMAPLLSLSGSARKIAPCRVVNTHQNIISVSAYSLEPCLSDKSVMHEVSLSNKDLEELNLLIYEFLLITKLPAECQMRICRSWWTRPGR